MRGTTYTTSEQIEIARKRVQQNKADAQYLAVLQDKFSSLIRMNPDALFDLVPDETVPRSSCTEYGTQQVGCPVHGTEIYRYNSRYPWKQDIRYPLCVICPIGGERYPSPEYPDDGTGWLSPEGIRLYFKACACLWLWKKTLGPGTRALATLYLVNDDEKAARTAIAILTATALYYPRMDYINQSPSPTRTCGAGILDQIWDVNLLRNLVSAGADLFDFADQDPVIRTFLQKKEIQSFRTLILENLVHPAAQHIIKGRIREAVGYHHALMSMLAIVDDNNAEWLSWVWDGTSKERPSLCDYLENDISRDGFPPRVSPGYNFGNQRQLLHVALDLRRTGFMDLFSRPRFQKMFEAPVRLIVQDGLTPSLGDCATIQTRSHIGWNKRLLGIAWQMTGKDIYLRALKESEEDDEGEIGPLFFEEIPARKIAKALPFISGNQIFHGFGYAILESGHGQDKISVTATFGPKRDFHGHADGLALEIFAQKKSLMPDLGYPERTSGPHMYGVVSHTLSHNTVMVNELRQAKTPGSLVGMGSTRGLTWITLDGRRMYERRFAKQLQDKYCQRFPEKMESYARRILLLEIGGSAVVIDVFSIKGGQRHDYIMHGSTPHVEFGDRKFTSLGETLSGTPYGSFEQDDLINARYGGSGHAFLRSPVTSPCKKPFDFEFDKLRVHVVSAEQCDLVYSKMIPQFSNPEFLPHVMLRRKAETDLESVFMVIYEPIPQKAGRLSVKLIYKEDNARVLKLTRGGETIFLVLSTDFSIAASVNVQIDKNFFLFQGELGIIRLKEKARHLTLFNGTSLSFNKHVLKGLEPLKGTVKSMDPVKGDIVLQVDSGIIPSESPETIIFKTRSGRFASFEVLVWKLRSNNLVSVTLKDGPPTLGCSNVRKSGPGWFVTTAPFILSDSGGFDGAYVVTTDTCQEYFVIASVKEANHFSLRSSAQISFSRPIIISAFAPGDSWSVGQKVEKEF